MARLTAETNESEAMHGLLILTWTDENQRVGHVNETLRRMTRELDNISKERTIATAM